MITCQISLKSSLGIDFPVSAAARPVSTAFFHGCLGLSVNGTNSRSDRQALFAEYSQLLQEFERMSQTANFNGHKLLDGSFTAQTFQVGANANPPNLSPHYPL